MICNEHMTALIVVQYVAGVIITRRDITYTKLPDRFARCAFLVMRLISVYANSSRKSSRDLHSENQLAETNGGDMGRLHFSLLPENDTSTI